MDSFGKPKTKKFFNPLGDSYTRFAPFAQLPTEHLKISETGTKNCKDDVLQKNIQLCL